MSKKRVVSEAAYFNSFQQTGYEQRIAARVAGTSAAITDKGH